MSELFLTNPAVDPTDLWRNLHYLRGRIEALEAHVAALARPPHAPPADRATLETSTGPNDAAPVPE